MNVDTKVVVTSGYWIGRIGIALKTVCDGFAHVQTECGIVFISRDKFVLLTDLTPVEKEYYGVEI